MSYIFKALVIDDEPLVINTCRSYKNHLEDRGINIDFDVANNEEQFDPERPYDILLVDYDLKKGFAKYGQLGDDLIIKFRERNKVSKIIFYSSSFKYKPDEEEFEFPFEGQTAFDLINDLQIDRIADKENFDMMLDVIQSCCGQIDYLPVMLSELLLDYDTNGIEVSYTDSRGVDISLDNLIRELLNDTKEGKHFKKQILDTMLSTLFNYQY